MTLLTGIDDAIRNGGISDTADFREAMRKTGVKIVSLPSSCGIWIPTSAKIAFRGGKPTFAPQKKTKGRETIFGLRTRVHRKRKKGKERILKPMTLLLLPPNCRLICEVEGRISLLIFQTMASRI